MDHLSYRSFAIKAVAVAMASLLMLPAVSLAATSTPSPTLGLRARLTGGTTALSSGTSVGAGTFTRRLTRGASGSDVTRLQQYLTRGGYLASGNTTGYFGVKTEGAVQTFQARHGIVSSGTPATTGYGAVGPKTAAAMQAPAVSSLPSATSLSPSTYRASANLKAGQAFKPINATTNDCPSGWVCPSTPVMDPSTKIGFWYEPWWEKPDYTPKGYFPSGVSWTNLTQYEPTYGYYWSGDPANIDYEFNLLNQIGADYLIIDDSNLAVIADKGNIEKNIQAIFAEDDKRPSGQRIPLALALGGELWAAHSVDAMDNSANFVYSTYVSQPVYYQWEGKPLLIDYNAYGIYYDGQPVGTTTVGETTAPEWSDPRFSVRYATGIVDQIDPGVLYSQQNYPGITTGGWWGWNTKYPQFNTSENVLIIPGADHTHQLYTNPAVACGTCSFHVDRQNGQTFMDAWLTAIKTKPKNITVASWNDYSEENGIEPAKPTWPQTPLWTDYYGTETPDWYMQIASGYMHLRQGLMAGAYFKDEDDSPVYQVVNGDLVYQAALPHGHPVITLPAGTIKALLGQSSTADTDIHGYKVVMTPAAAPPASGPVATAAVMATGAVTDSSNQNPYDLKIQSGSTYTVSVPSLAGYSIGYTLCLDNTTCHNETPTPGNSATVTIPSGSGHFADLWWHYTPTSSGGETPPTAGLTANGTSTITVHSTDKVVFSWSSSHAASAVSTYSVDVPDTCARGSLDLPVSRDAGTFTLSPAGACRIGHTYTVTYTAIGSDGTKATGTATVTVIQ